MGPLFDEQFRRLQCHAARPARDDRNFVLKLIHDVCVFNLFVSLSLVDH
jgi:hypothetical protein